MLQPIMSIRDWLELVQQNSDNGSWMSKNENDLHAALKTGLQRPPTFHDAVELLMQVIPRYAFVLSHHKLWMPLLLEALLQAQDLRDNGMQVQILTQLGEAYLSLGKNEAARDAFEIALGRAKDGDVKEMLLASYIGIIRIQSVRMGDEYDPELMAQALALSREIPDLVLKAETHLSLALAYIHTRETVAAIEHGQIAYIYWHRLKNDVGLARTLYLLSAAYRFIWSLKRAEELLQWTSERFGDTDYNRQYTFLAYETGALYIQSKEYGVALQWLTLALREAISIDYFPSMVSCYHALGIAETGLEAFDKAETHLKEAIAGWEKLNNFFELASAYQAMGNLENKRNCPKDALENLEKARALCVKLPAANQRTWLENHIQATIDEIVW
ncbi:MAG: hypothetical protein ABI690_30140 [Chloroflexota bacterium]